MMKKILVALSLAVFFSSSAIADRGRYSKSDLCHWHKKKTVEAVLHDAEGRLCERNWNRANGLKDITIKYGVVEKLIEVAGPVETIIVKDINVLEFEQALGRVIHRLDLVIEHEANRPARVVEVSVEVPGLKPANDTCLTFRARILTEAGRSFGEDDAGRLAVKAIKAGCL